MRGNETLKLPEDRSWTSKGNILADNRTVCTISVIHSQIKDPEKVIVYCQKIDLEEEESAEKS